MTIVTIVNCSVSRRVEPVVKVGDLPPGLTQQEALDQWTLWIDNHSGEAYTPEQIYTGGGFQELASIKKYSDKTYIVTGGQGLLPLDKSIVPYDFSGDPKEAENIQQKVTSFRHGIWWMGVNEKLGQSPHPVADLVADPDTTLVVIAVTKTFLKYLSLDLGYIPLEDQHKLVLLTTSSNLGALGTGVRGLATVYSDSYIEGLGGFRHNKPFKALAKFLQHVQEEGKESALEAVKSSTKRDVLSSSSNHQTGSVNYDTLFGAHPELLGCETPQQLIRMAKSLNLSYGGKKAFIAAWQCRTGMIESAIGEVSVSESEEQALESLFPEDQEVEAYEPADGLPSEVKLCAEFVAVTKQLQEKRDKPIVFTAANVVEWLKKVDPLHDPPAVMKVYYALLNYGEGLGLIQVTRKGKPAFTLKTSDQHQKEP